MMPVPAVGLLCCVVAGCVAAAGPGRVGGAALAPPRRPPGTDRDAVEAEGFDGMVAAVVDAAVDGAAREAAAVGSAESRTSRRERLRREAVGATRGLLADEIHSLVSLAAKAAAEAVLSHHGSTPAGAPPVAAAAAIPAPEAAELLQGAVAALRGESPPVGRPRGFGASFARAVSEAVGAARESFDDPKIVGEIKETTSVQVSKLARDHVNLLSERTRVEVRAASLSTGGGGPVAAEKAEAAGRALPGKGKEGEHTIANVTTGNEIEDVHHVADATTKSGFPTPHESLLSHSVLGVRRLFEEEEDANAEPEPEDVGETDLEHELASDQEQMMQRLVSSLGDVVR